MNFNQIPTQALYELYLTDIMGTTTPKSEITKVTDLILDSPEMQEEISRKTGQPEIKEIISKGLERAKASQKDHPEFKAYLKVWDIGAQIGYKNGKLAMSLEEGVGEALEYIRNAGGRIRVFSSGAVESSELGMKSNGLDRLIEAYHSSSQPEIGSKFMPDAYREIARQAVVEIKDMAYVTDDVKEAKAAVEAGVGKVFLIDKKAETGEKDGYVIVKNYQQVAEQTTQKDNKQKGAEKAEASE